jgi:hypothetical protein
MNKCLFYSSLLTTLNLFHLAKTGNMKWMLSLLVFLQKYLMNPHTNIDKPHWQRPLCDRTLIITLFFQPSQKYWLTSLNIWLLLDLQYFFLFLKALINLSILANLLYNFYYFQIQKLTQLISRNAFAIYSFQGC